MEKMIQTVSIENGLKARYKAASKRLWGTPQKIIPERKRLVRIPLIIKAETPNKIRCVREKIKRRIGSKGFALREVHRSENIDNVGLSVPFTSNHVCKLVVKACAKKHGIFVSDIMSARRSRKFVKARYEAFYRIRKKTCFSYPQIAKFFGRDHTTVMHGLKTHEQSLTL